MELTAATTAYADTSFFATFAFYDFITRAEQSLYLNI